jgi:hypothetical protein
MGRTVVQYERIPDYRKSDICLPKIRVKSSPYFADIAYCISRVKQGSLQSVPQINLPLHAQNLEAIVKQYIVPIEIRADGSNTFVFLGIMTLTAIVCLITIDFMYSQSSGQTNTLFKM